MIGRELVVGTRGSALALTQTQIVCDALRRLNPSLVIRVERITTTGDERGDVPLAQLGRGVFVTEIEAALRAGRIDFAVHSAKDLPSVLSSDLTLGAILPREDARDVIVSPHGTLRKLPIGARVGTSSPRRACQLRVMRPDLEPIEVRGNVDTRLRKLAAGDFDALVLAAAGLIRLGRASEVTEWLDAVLMVPSVGQGALAVEARANDERILQLVRRLDDAPTRAAVTAERAFLAELGAGCRAAAGAYARVEGDRLRIVALIGSVEGQHVRAVRTGAALSPVELGISIARELLRGGGGAFLARPDSALAHKTIAVTRAVEQSRDMIELLRANGAQAIACPTIAIDRDVDNTALDAALRRLASVSWIAFTSVNAVHAFADRMSALGVQLPASVLIAAVGASTAAALSQRMRAPDFISSRADAETLAEEMPDVRGETVLLPLGDRAADLLPSRLRARGAQLIEAVVYRTVRGPGVDELEALTREGSLDAAIFMSPSSLRFAADVLTGVSPNERPAIVCIGATTARAARELGVEPDVVSATQSVGGIVESLERWFAQERERSAVLASH